MKVARNLFTGIGASAAVAKESRRRRIKLPPKIFHSVERRHSPSFGDSVMHKTHGRAMEFGVC
jgi:hypothetical protein